jgi:ribosomal protein L11 methyltransferase
MAKSIVLSAPAQLPTELVDLLLANIVAGTLIQLASHFSTLVRQQGQLVLSGMLIQQVEEVRAAFTPWFDFRLYQQQEEWVLLQAVRRY